MKFYNLKLLFNLTWAFNKATVPFDEDLIARPAAIPDFKFHPNHIKSIRDQNLYIQI